jgi:predicted N-acetyltransferase YhbS
MNIVIRPEIRGDVPLIARVNNPAFGQPVEAFMAVELVPGRLAGVYGTVEFPEEYVAAL